jgi:hypothetical protein
MQSSLSVALPKIVLPPPANPPLPAQKRQFTPSFHPNQGDPCVKRCSFVVVVSMKDIVGGSRRRIGGSRRRSQKMQKKKVFIENGNSLPVLPISGTFKPPSLFLPS